MLRSTVSLVIITLASQLLAASKVGLPQTIGTLTVESGSAQIIRGGQVLSGLRRRERALAGDRLTILSGHSTLSLTATKEIWRLGTGASVDIDSRNLALLSGPKPELVAHLGSDSSARSGPPKLHLGSSIRGAEHRFDPLGSVRSGPVIVRWDDANWANTAQISAYTLEGKTIGRIDVENITSGAESLPPEWMKPGSWIRVRLSLNGQDAPTEVRETVVRTLTSAQIALLGQAESDLKASLASEPILLATQLCELLASYGLISELPDPIKVIYSDLESPTARGFLGLMLKQAGFIDEARKVLTEAVEDGDKDAEIVSALQDLDDPHAK